MTSLIKVATLNLHNRHNRWSQRRHLVVSELVDLLPDLVSLQELNFSSNQGKWVCNQINTRLSGSARTPYRIVQGRLYHFMRGYFEGVGILTKLPIISHDTLNLGYDGRIALRANLALPTGDSMDFVAVHLHHIAHDHEARLEQVMLVAGWLNDVGRVPLQIIAGDFNELPDGPAIVQMKQTYKSAMEEARGYEPLATFPTVLAGRQDGWAGCLDYIYVSSEISVESATIFANRPHDEDHSLYPSDHVGLAATVDIEPRLSLRKKSVRRV